MVLSQSLSFTDFRVLREVYLPDTNLFLADYPFMRRPEFQQISDDIEAARYNRGSQMYEDARPW